MLQPPGHLPVGLAPVIQAKAQAAPPQRHGALGRPSAGLAALAVAAPCVAGARLRGRSRTAVQPCFRSASSRANAGTSSSSTCRRAAATAEHELPDARTERNRPPGTASWVNGQVNGAVPLEALPAPSTQESASFAEWTSEAHAPPARRRRPIGGFILDVWESAWSDKPPPADTGDTNMITAVRVVLPTVLAFVLGCAVYVPFCEILQDLLDIGNTRRGPILSMLGMDQSQFMQNFLTVNGLLFTILCGNTYTALYQQQERLYHALFSEVSEAKSLLEQACLVCQGRPFYPKVLDSLELYVKEDLRRLDLDPADLLANKPMDDPLEFILYATSVGVPSIVYDTVRDLRQARGYRLGAMQRKLPPIHFALLYVLGALELLAFPLLGAGTASMSKESSILLVQAIFFGAMCGAIVMTLQVIYELWKPFGGAYTVDGVLSKMVSGLEEELTVRKSLRGNLAFEPWPAREDPGVSASSAPSVG